MNKKEQPQYGQAATQVNTRCWPLTAHTKSEQEQAIQEAAQLLAQGQTVAFPTETVYGLGADATSTAAVEQIFYAKGRPSDNPLIVHVADQSEVELLVQPYNELVSHLMERFWPGPLTLVLPVRQGAVSPKVTAGLATVAVRMPDHAVARRLIRAAGCPIAAPSANRSGRPSPTTAAHVMEDLDGRIAGIVDGGPTGVGVESTVVEVHGDRVHVLRPGGVTLAMLQEFCSQVTIDPAVDPEGGMLHHGLMERVPNTSAAPGVDSTVVTPVADSKIESNSVSTAIVESSIEQISEPNRLSTYEHELELFTSNSDDTNVAASTEAPRSPGMKYTHYAPTGVMCIVRGASADAISAYIQADIADAKRRGETTGVLAFREHTDRYRADVVAELGSLSELNQAAQLLYSALRRFDDAGVTYILAEACPTEGIGLAVMNRLVKAAGHRIVQVL
ncbi:threonylcarbamoyl-AMP synthase [Paenibacillus sp. ACRRX]|uniref:L-threonylcarbamoyladenylate synthase n=1 Tax=Paenibacillus sp. ACRRX TaxID=2918206 RepID=UPI001EF5B64D|nr:L-threonylcarbamoyladenylate synthase [Paenibacillus sp. ACRRX]MCG7408053.1 threonylcarbamoyl-AMP synthase [Paenibacillus sp. ACRRX]